MKLEQTIQTMFDENPSLFQYRWEALVYMFLVTGTGYEWVNGELVDFYGSDKFSGTLGKDGKAVQRKRDDMLDSVMEDFRKMGMDEDMISSLMNNAKNDRSNRHKETPDLSDIYICGDCPLYDDQINIKPDWIAGMNEVKQILVQAGVPYDVMYGNMDKDVRSTKLDEINRNNYIAKRQAESDALMARFDSLGPDGLKLLADIWNEV